MMLNTVVIPMDGSPFSQKILSEVCRFLAPDKHRLILLQVADPPRGGTGIQAALLQEEMTHEGLIAGRFSERDIVAARHPIYDSQIEDSAAANLKIKLGESRRALEAAGYIVSTEIRFGKPIDEIVRFIEHEDVDLVAMSTHGRTGIERLVMGSVAEQVLRQVSVPVMMCRPF